MQVDRKPLLDIISTKVADSELFGPSDRNRSLLGWESVADVLASIEEAHWVRNTYHGGDYPTLELLLRVRCARLANADPDWPEHGWVMWSSLDEDIRPWVLGDGARAEEPPLFDLRQARRLFRRQLQC